MHDAAVMNQQILSFWRVFFAVFILHFQSKKKFVPDRGINLKTVSSFDDLDS